MTKSALFASLVAFAAVVSVTRDAHAQSPFLDGGITYANTTCTTTGAADKATGTWTGVFSGAAPRANQVTYIHMVAMSSSGCYNSDTVGLELEIPANATLAISAANPVFCYRGHDAYVETVPNSSTSACLQSPTQGAKGKYFGFSQIASFNSLGGPWWFEIQVPVIFSTDGPKTVTSWASSAWLFAGPNNTTSHYGASAVSFPVLTNSIPTPSPAAFSNYAATSNAGGDAVTATFGVQTNFQVGDVTVEWGTSTSFGQVTSPARTHLLEPGYPSVSATLINTPSATTIYWRPRFTIGTTTYVGATQSIRTNTMRLPRPIPIIPPRCTGFCPAF